MFRIKFFSVLLYLGFGEHVHIKSTEAYSE